ncbi:hypothetical protein AVEN_5425-1 [Araneus ventricosus]|uniref:Uncharacterized protein n=1 Tax=Araneus ventricosus TaxID=182803 RepID=A0A4Y2M922_ARAVE|nr:hypothetical protein AVEN_5425-1 [Araneus ventricosus]
MVENSVIPVLPWYPWTLNDSHCNSSNTDAEVLVSITGHGSIPPVGGFVTFCAVFVMLLGMSCHIDFVVFHLYFSTGLLKTLHPFGYSGSARVLNEKNPRKARKGKSVSASVSLVTPTWGTPRVRG